MPKKKELPLGLVDNTAERHFVFRRIKKGKRYYRGFSYRQDQEREKVKRAAIRYANKMNREIGPPETTPVGTMTSRNSTGVVGVALSRNEVAGNEYFSWVARWPGNRSGVRFSLNAHGGDDRAFLLACIAREIKTADLARIERTYKRWRQSGKAQQFLDRKRIEVVDD